VRATAIGRVNDEAVEFFGRAATRRTDTRTLWNRRGRGGGSVPSSEPRGPPPARSPTRDASRRARRNYYAPLLNGRPRAHFFGARSRAARPRGVTLAHVAPRQRPYGASVCRASRPAGTSSPSRWGRAVRDVRPCSGLEPRSCAAAALDRGRREHLQGSPTGARARRGRFWTRCRCLHRTLTSRTATASRLNGAPKTRGHGRRAFSVPEVRVIDVSDPAAPATSRSSSGWAARPASWRPASTCPTVERPSGACGRSRGQRCRACGGGRESRPSTRGWARRARAS